MFADLEVESALVVHVPEASEFPKFLGKRDGDVLAAADTDTDKTSLRGLVSQGQKQWPQTTNQMVRRG